MIPISASQIMTCLPGCEQKTPATSKGFGASNFGGQVAVVEILGPIEASNSAKIQNQIKAAELDDSVGAIALLIDSPGGYASACLPLAEVVQESAAVKPVHAFVGSVCASGAFLAASQATTITASEWSTIGGIGTYTVLFDTEELFKQMGVKVLVIRAGRYKGVGIPGTAITVEQQEEIGRMVDGVNRLFVSAVSRGRGIPMKTMFQEIATGQVWLAASALERRLIDRVSSLTDFLAGLAKQFPGEMYTKLTDWEAVEQFCKLVNVPASTNVSLYELKDKIAKLKPKHPTLVSNAVCYIERKQIDRLAKY